MYKKLIVAGISQDALGFKINVEDFDEFSSAESKSELTDYGVFKSKFYQRKTVVKEYKINVLNATVSKIDKLKKWLLKENVTFSDYTDSRFCIAYKINIHSSQRKASDLYTLVVTVERSPFYYSNELKTFTSSGNTITVDSSCDFLVYPTIEFTVTRNLKMITISKSLNEFYRIGKEDGDTIFSIGDVVKIDMEKGEVLVNGTKRIYADIFSKRLSIKKGHQQLRIGTNAQADMPILTLKYREVYL